MADDISRLTLPNSMMLRMRAVSGFFLCLVCCLLDQYASFVRPAPHTLQRQERPELFSSSQTRTRNLLWMFRPPVKVHPRKSTSLNSQEFSQFPCQIRYTLVSIPVLLLIPPRLKSFPYTQKQLQSLFSLIHHPLSNFRLGT